jgi:hypothetical protein
MTDVDTARGFASTASPADAATSTVDLDEALKRAIRGGPAVTDAHLRLLERDIVVGNTKTNLHCYFLPLDGNGRVRFKPLAEFLRDKIIDYAIPRRAIEEAKRQMAATGSVAPIAKLQAQARGVFTHLAQSGEGGEILLFAMAEAVFGLTQILCKMSLKTSSSMHYHGADGVYALQIDYALTHLLKSIDVPAAIILRHPGVSAAALQSLLKYFRSRKKPIEGLNLPNIVKREIDHVVERRAAVLSAPKLA